MDAFVWNMYFVAVIGSFAGLFWPSLIRAFNKVKPFKIKMLSRVPNGWLKILASIVLGIVIASIAAALGFFAFMQDAETRKTLQELGALAYFSAFTYGFSSASAVEGALSKEG